MIRFCNGSVLTISAILFFASRAILSLGRELPQDSFPTIEHRAHGIIVDQENRPVPGVELTPSWTDPTLESDGRTIRIKTDSEGYWQWDVSLHPKIYALRSFKQGYNQLEFSLEPLHLQRSVLSNALSIQGFVVDEQGLEVEGALVSCTVDNANFASHPSQTVLSDNRGWFEMVGSPQLTSRLWAIMPNGENGYFQASSSTQLIDPVIELKKPVSLTLEIVDERAKPIQGATCSLGSWNQSGAIQWTGNSDNDGIARWPNAPTGTLVFEIRKDGFYRKWCKFDHSIGQSQRIALHSVPGMITKVVDSQTGQPIDTFIVRYANENAMSTRAPNQNVLGWNSEDSLPNNMIVAKDGKFLRDSLPFADFLEIELTAIGYERQRIRFDALNERETQREIRLRKPFLERTEIANLVNADGSVAIGANVAFVSNDSIPLTRDAAEHVVLHQWPHYIQQQRTNTAGQFRLAAHPVLDFVAAWNEKGTYLGPLAGLRNGNTIQLSTFATIRVRIPHSMRTKRFHQFAIQQNIESANGFSKSQLVSELTFVESEDSFVCSQVPAGSISVIQRSLDFNTRRVKTTPLATTTIVAGSNRELDLR
jgi:hypothetical protein